MEKIHTSVSANSGKELLELMEISLGKGTDLNKHYTKLSNNFHFFFGADEAILQRVIEQSKRYLDGDPNFVDETLFEDYVKEKRKRFFKTFRESGEKKRHSLTLKTLSQIIEQQGIDYIENVKEATTTQEFVFRFKNRDDYMLYIDNPPMMPTLSLEVFIKDLRLGLGFFTGVMGEDIYYHSKEDMLDKLTIALNIFDFVAKKLEWEKQ